MLMRMPVAAAATTAAQVDVQYNTISNIQFEHLCEINALFSPILNLCLRLTHCFLFRFNIKITII